jgi:hypothetical protein
MAIVAAALGHYQSVGNKLSLQQVGLSDPLEPLGPEPAARRRMGSLAANVSALSQPRPLESRNC